MWLNQRSDVICKTAFQLKKEKSRYTHGIIKMCTQPDKLALIFFVIRYHFNEPADEAFTVS